ncbi:MAG TPA: DUF3574 domain-containing protein [Reyranella sp.]|nr:DUF3574 domain-containing protein [Reyranella sp.]
MALLLGACAQQPPPAACPAPLEPAVEVDLYFGLAKKKGEVSPAEWAAFLDREVTPLFPDGLSVVDIYGQYRDAPDHISHERSKLLVVIVFDPAGLEAKVQAIVDAYKTRFDQKSVLQVEKPVCTSLHDKPVHR